METKEMSIEDRIKPYLILAKSIEYSLTKDMNNERRLEKENLLNKIFRQLLKQVKLKEIGINGENYWGFEDNIIEQFGLNLEQMDKEMENFQND